VCPHTETGLPNLYRSRSCRNGPCPSARGHCPCQMASLKLTLSASPMPTPHLLLWLRSLYPPAPPGTHRCRTGDPGWHGGPVHGCWWRWYASARIVSEMDAMPSATRLRVAAKGDMPSAMARHPSEGRSRFHQMSSRERPPADFGDYSIGAAELFAAQPAGVVRCLSELLDRTLCAAL